MTDTYEGRATTITAPARHAFAVMPSDSEDLPAETRAIYVGASGNLAVTFGSGDEVTFAGLAAGALLPLRVKRIKASGTTADLIVGLY